MYKEKYIMNHDSSISPKESLQKLLSGNLMFQKQQTSHHTKIGNSYREKLVGGQTPYAIILTCSDSRTPPEHIFNAGLGELFVCRNAGNLVDELILGSIEYAAVHTGCPLVCVLGHNNCGAMSAAVSVAKNLDLYESPSIDHIIRRALPAVFATMEEQADDKAWTDAAAKKNIFNQCRNIINGSKLLRERIANKEFGVAGAWYDLGTGKVKLLYENR